MPVIVHIDMNCFFASCEIKRNPSYKGKKLIVGSVTNSGVVCAASYEARVVGIHSAMPIYEARNLAPDAIFLPCDIEYYEEVSHEIFTFLKSRYPVLQMASIDEAYIDMSEINITKNPRKYFEDLQKEIYEKMHIPCSIGVSYNTFLAKMGSDYKKPLGITIIHKDDVKKIIHPLPIDDFFGIGKATGSVLKEYGIKTIGDLLTFDEVKLRTILGNNYESIIHNAKGDYANHVILNHEPPKSLGCSYTLQNATSDYETLKENFKYLCLDVANKLKAYNMLAYNVTIKVRYPNFETYQTTIRLIEPTSDVDVLLSYALKLFEPYTGKVIRLLGVTGNNLIGYDNYIKQMSIFDKTSDIDELVSNFNKLAGDKLFIKASDYKKHGK